MRTELEKQQIKLRLHAKIEEFLEAETESDHAIGFLPDNIEMLMADAAFAVLSTVTDTNKYFEENAD